MSIGLSSQEPYAGIKLRMTCSVVSTATVMLTWADPTGQRVTRHNLNNITVEMNDEGLSLIFQSLQTSHGGLYTCVASVGGAESAQMQDASYFLKVHSKNLNNFLSLFFKLFLSVPPPFMSVTTDREMVYPMSDLMVVCKVGIIKEVDTPIRVNTHWNTPTTIYGNSRVTMREERSNAFMHKSILLIHPVLFSDAGLYTCIASIETDALTVVGMPWATEGLNLAICKCKMFIELLCKL